VCGIRDRRAIVFLRQVALYNKGLQRNGGKRYYQAWNASPSAETQAVRRITVLRRKVRDGEHP
jgi:hypothetical protein